MNILPVLYKKTNTGAIQFWSIEVEKHGLYSNEAYSRPKIKTTFGQVDTDSPQVTYDTIREGKNAGRKNATTALQQAEKEAKSKWEKQKKKGYVETIEAAEAGEIDALIEGGIVPMLAQPFSKYGHKIVYPCWAQPKIDGVRCIAIVENGVCTLWSRTRKLITGVPHIARALEKRYPTINIILDGELYNHLLKKDFEKIVSFVRQDEPQPGHEVIQYHVYDVVRDEPFRQRINFIPGIGADGTVFPVQNALIDEEGVMNIFDSYLRQGYEGAMLRNREGKYAHKRSYDLQKVKEFDDGEFDIIGIDEGRGKLAGHVGAFICRNEKGKEFLAKMSGDTGRLRDYFENHSLWRGKRLTVQYQGLTGKEGVPRFPVGIAIRDYE